MGDRLEELVKEYEACRIHCDMLYKELEDLKEFERKKKIEGITLKTDARLIELLYARILDPESDWKSKLDILTSIPHDIKDVLNGGDYMESLFQIAVAIGVLPQFRDYPVNFYDINNYRDKVSLKNYLYIKSVNNKGGKEQGVADIFFESVVNQKDIEPQQRYSCGEVPVDTLTENPHYFVSVKGFKREKSITDYDISDIKLQADIFSGIKEKRIVVCVRNKEQFLKRLSRSKKGFITNSVNHVIGYDDIINAFSSFRTNFFLRFDHFPPTEREIQREVLTMFPEDKQHKPSISLYFHQELVARSVVKRIGENPDPKDPYFLCVGVLPRGGKSFIAGAIMDMHKKMLGKGTYNVLFLTSAINETREQFKEDLIEKFSEFDDFEFIDVVDKPKKIDKDKNKFVFVSRQLSSMADDSDVDKSDLEGLLAKLNKKTFLGLGGIPKFDICFFDEAHIGIRSGTVKQQFKNAFSKFKLPIVLMSATYKNPAEVLTSPKDLFVWDLQDIKDMKELPALKVDGFVQANPDVLQRYPGIAEELLRKRVAMQQKEEDIARPYMNFPIPNFISLTFTPETIKHLKDIGSGYNFSDAFKFKQEYELLSDNDRHSEWGTLFTNREQALRIRQFLTPDQEEGDDFLTNQDRKFRAFNQVFRIAQKTGSRPFIGKPFSVLMFLPSGSGQMPVGETCRVWGSFLRELAYWRNNFVIMTLSKYSKHKKIPGMNAEIAVKRGFCHRDDWPDSFGLKKIILDVEREALKNDKGLLLLSGDVAKMGISLKCIDVVCLLNDSHEPDDIIQKMYRALTDDPPTKKNGYIVDLNLKRVITAMFSYELEKAKRTETKDKTTAMAQRIEQLMELCNWGQDAFIQDNPDKSFDDIMNEIKQRVFLELETNVRLEYGTRDLVDRQFDIIRSNEALLKQVSDVLKFTTGKRTASRGKEEVLLKANEEIPDKDEPLRERQDPGEKKPEVEPLSPEQIKQKIINIMQTFVNALVIKSDEPWEGMTFKTLIDKYATDKHTGKPKCSCEGEHTCGNSNSNLYDIAFCELKGYAMLEKGTETIYSPETHRMIMEIMDEIFKASGELAPEWTLYIESLIHDITKNQLDDDDHEGGRRKTERNKTKHINNNGRSTKRNNS